MGAGNREGLGARHAGAVAVVSDALGWDRPFYVMPRAFRETGDPSQIWDGHFAGREREVFIVQQVHNLASVPPSGFTIGCFPLRLNHCSAGPARVVAFVPDLPQPHRFSGAGGRGPYRRPLGTLWYCPSLIGSSM